MSPRGPRRFLKPPAKVLGESPFDVGVEQLLDLPDQPHYADDGQGDRYARMARRQAKPCLLLPFPDLPLRERNLLVAAHFTSIRQIQATPDEELAHTHGLGSTAFKVVRTLYPYDASLPLPALMPCPCCGGEGQVRRFHLRFKTRKPRGITQPPKEVP